MSDFVIKKATPLPAQADPTKHVNYTYGMVLGVDDLVQEFAYQSNRDQWLARDLVGYGTVRGLQVSLQDDGAKGPRISIGPGAALTPRGELVCVPTEQCAWLNKWLADVMTNPLKSELRAQFLRRIEWAVSSPASPHESIRLYATLCYRACPTDDMPIPGEPCRDESDAMEPSRWMDDFQLELRLEPPSQVEEDAVRGLVDWLRQIDVSPTASSTPLPDFLTALRHAASPASSPPGSPPSSPLDYMVGSPPTSLHIHSDDACAYWREAFRVWATELRAQWTARSERCSYPPMEGCLLLAEVLLPLSADRREVAGYAADVRVDESRRPYVLHLRLLQEWLLCAQRTNTSIPMPLSSPLISPGAVPNPATTVVQETGFGQSAAAGSSPLYARADHTHGTPTDPIPPHLANTGAHANHAVVGDVTGTLAATSVQRIRGLGVNVTGAQAGQVLTFRGTEWRVEPVVVPPATGNFVEHPSGLPRYSIVAAGLVGAGPVSPVTPAAPIYNGLKVVNTLANRVRFSFVGYKPPKDEWQYIVKALVVFNTDVQSKLHMQLPIVTFFGFFDDGFDLMVTDLGNTIESDRLKQLEFMIEVSQFFK